MIKAGLSLIRAQRRFLLVAAILATISQTGLAYMASIQPMGLLRGP
jgi:hypothetical protein